MESGSPDKKKIRRHDSQDKFRGPYCPRTDNLNGTALRLHKGDRAISLKECFVPLKKLPAPAALIKNIRPAIQENRHSIQSKCQKIAVPNIRGTLKPVFTGYLDQALAKSIVSEVQLSLGMPDTTSMLRRQNGRDILAPHWEIYLQKNQVSQGMFVCHGDAGLHRWPAVPMPGEEQDREIVPAAYHSIIQLVNTIHALNPDIKKIFGQNALRLATLNYYFHHPTASGSKSLTDFCLNWHVDKSKLGQLVACINLAGQRTLNIRYQGKVTEIQSDKPGHFYLFDGTQFEHAVQLTNTENSMALVLRSPFMNSNVNIHDYFNNAEVFLPASE